MRLREFTALWILLGGLTAHAEPPSGSGSAVVPLLVDLARLGVNAGNQYDAKVKSGIENHTSKNSLQRAYEGGKLGTSEGQATLDASRPYFDNKQPATAAASTFWSNAANQGNDDFRKAADDLSSDQRTEMAKSAPVGQDDPACATDNSKCRDGKGKASQAASVAAEGLAGEMARFWGMLQASVKQTDQDRADGAAMGINACLDAACRFSAGGLAIFQEATKVGQLAAEFAAVRDANQEVAAYYKEEDAFTSGGAAAYSTNVADATSDIPAAVVDTLTSAGLDPADIQNRIASGDKTVFKDLSSALGAEEDNTELKDIAGGADLERGEVTGGKDVSIGGAFSGGSQLTRGAVTGGANLGLQARLGATGQLAGGARAGVGQSLNPKAAAAIDLLRKSFQRKHGGKVAGDDDESSLAALGSFVRAAKAKARGLAGEYGGLGDGNLSDESLYNLRRAGVQKRRGTNIFQVARLTYRKQADAQSVRRPHASAVRAPAWKLAETLPR